jgi:hypothetical protein
MADQIRPQPSLARLALASALGVVSCGGAPAPGGHMTCEGGDRIVLDCASEVAYQGAKGSGSVGVFNVASGSASYEERAIRKVNDELARYVAVQTRLCRDYNACVLGREQYVAEAKRTREIFDRVARDAEAYSVAASEGAKRAALGRVYSAVVPEAQRSEELSVSLAVDVELPAGAGGGRLTLSPGAPLPTGARIAFRLQASKAAHFYLFQKKPSGELAVLFPDARIGVTNPVAAATPLEIPSGGRRFKVDDKDLGLENVYLVAARNPIARLDGALRKVTDGATLAVAPELRPVASIAVGGNDGCRTRALELEGDAPTGCVRSRGLSLEGDGPAAGANASLSVRTEAGDDTIVVSFPFEHVGESAYADARKRFDAKRP